MKTIAHLALIVVLAGAAWAHGEPRISDELKQWHKVTITFDGPSAKEADQDPNPFLDYRLTVAFRHDGSEGEYVVPGYFAADGNAANTSAESGDKWRVHFAPDRPGRWSFRVSFVKGRHVAIDANAKGEAVSGIHDVTGGFEVAATDKAGRDFRGKGRLQYAGRHHLRFAGTGEYFLKAGADSPESLLAYKDFDNTVPRKPDAPQRQGEAKPKGLHHYEPHLKDWKQGDPTWKDGKGKALIGALNYLASTGVNAVSFLTYNSGGDGDNVWPMVQPDDKLHYDCSKLDQWQIVLDHAQAMGLYLHFKMQETENDDNNRGKDFKGTVPDALDGGDLGMQRKLYCRELVARFGYHLALNWNLGEENTQTPQQQRAMAAYIREVDPYDHHIVVHTYPGEQEKVYSQLVGDQSVLTGVSMQNNWNQTHRQTLRWVTESAQRDRPWVCANDEQGPADMGVPPDPGYQGHDGKAIQGKQTYDLHDIRKQTLWGNLMAGGAGVEYYFGYKLPENDLGCNDWRSRDQSWKYCRIALEFFEKNRIPFWEMANANSLVGNAKNDPTRFCLAKTGEVYVVYLLNGETTEIDLGGASGELQVQWYDPRNGGEFRSGSVRVVSGGAKASIGAPPSDAGQDWIALLRKAK